jgi:hypothetical protein
MIRNVTTVLVLFAFALGGWAQTSPPQHQHSDTVIDGAKNPELIPDSTALRLWLVTVSELPNATAQDRDRQSAHLAKLRLTELDNLQLVTLLADFKSQYLSLIDRYNESAKAALAHGVEPDLKLFLQQRDDLVQTTKAAMALRLSHETVTRIDAHVQEHKKNIQLHARDCSRSVPNTNLRKLLSFLFESPEHRWD